MIDDRYYTFDGILFDKDGTLVDFAELWLGWANEWVDTIKEKCGEVDINQYELCKKIGLNREANQWDPEGPLAIGSNRDAEALFASYLYENGLPWNEAIACVIQSRETVDASYNEKRCLKLTPGLASFLHQLDSASIPIGVITSDDTERAQRQLQILDIAKYFGCILGNDAVSKGKPFPDMAEEACRQLNILPQNTVIIGDSNGDMMTGKNARMLLNVGILPAQIPTSHHLKAANHVIRDYENMTISR